jgi:hypothetical protein
MRNLLLWAVLSSPLSAQPDPGDLLLRVRDKVLNTVDRLPRYLCTQTVDRAQYEPSVTARTSDCEELERTRGTRFVPVRTTADRLRLDVGVAHGTEAYSWVGENRFGDQTLFDIVKEGALSTGYFHGFLTLVFRSDHAEFSFAGQRTAGARKLFEYGFVVALDASHYVFRTGGKAYTTAYEGTILADAATAELVELNVRTRNMPSETNACEVSTSMKYGRWQVNDSNFLLPTETNMRIRHGNAMESQNRTTYTGCHEFLGESTVRFGPPEEGAKTAAKSPVTPASAPFPDGLRFIVELAQDIEVATAAAGDPVKAVLAADLLDGATVLAPKGTPVACRIQTIRRYYRAPGQGDYEPQARVELLLRLESLGGPAGVRPITARPFRESPERPRQGSLAQRQAMNLGPLSALEANLWSALFENAGDDYVIRSGLAMEWMTRTR